jgi:hypothetical protein
MADGCRRLLYLVIKYEAMIFVGLALAQLIYIQPMESGKSIILDR